MISERAKRLSVNAESSIREVMEVIDREGTGLALILAADGRLTGIATDGDIRRGLLRGLALTDPVASVMNPRPCSAPASATPEELAGLMRTQGVRQLPILDPSGRLTDVAVFTDFLRRGPLDITAVLMAGGAGSRLRPLTEATPKPMLPLGRRPILEISLRQLASLGVHDFYITTCFLPERIREHFGDGRAFGVSIKYLEEKEALGTAGGLRLIEARATDPLLVMNGDVLTKLDFARMLDYHRDRQSEMTVAVRKYAMQIPYGVVRVSEEEITQLDEKPVFEYSVSGGVYLVGRAALSLIPPDRPSDMPELVESLLAQRRRVVAFPIEDYWIDIGQVSDFERALAEAARWESEPREKPEGQP